MNKCRLCFDNNPNKIIQYGGISFHANRPIDGKFHCKDDLFIRSIIAW